MKTMRCRVAGSSPRRGATSLGPKATGLSVDRSRRGEPPATAPSMSSPAADLPDTGTASPRKLLTGPRPIEAGDGAADAPRIPQRSR